MFKITFYAPASHVEQIKQAMFEAGAGKIGAYSHCAWQVIGEGQFMPLEGSDPYIGQNYHIEKIVEYKVELVCENRFIENVITSLKKSHPYETPAYHVTKVEPY